MKKYGGFTIVELIIVITVMAILLVIGVVSLRSTQVQARDDERKVDVENIARAFEVFYRSNDTQTSAYIGTYPGTTQAGNESVLRASMRDLDPKSLRTPGTSDSSTMSLTMATNAITTTTGVIPQPTINTYVYQPIKTDGTLCSTHTTNDPAQQCRRFFLYYRSEATNEVLQMKSIQQ